MGNEGENNNYNNVVTGRKKTQYNKWIFIDSYFFFLRIRFVEFQWDGSFRNVGI